MLITGSDREEQKIILLDDIRSSKCRKEEELEFYSEQLEKLLQKMSQVQQEIDLTNRIISMIESESIKDLTGK